MLLLLIDVQVFRLNKIETSMLDFHLRFPSFAFAEHI